MMDEPRAKLRSFLYRDYSADANRLNDIISRPGRSAQLEPSIPPFTYSGNPFALRPKHCFALLGLNPVWLGPEAEGTKKEYWPVKRAIDTFRSGEEIGFQKYRRIREDYFEDSSELYYPTYFSRLGNYIGEHLCGYTDAGRKNFARWVFRKSIFKTDFLPWCSRNADGIDWLKVANSQDKALTSYYDLLGSFLKALEPRWIQCNGKKSQVLAEHLFGCRFSEESIDRSNGRRWIFLVSETTKPIRVPIFMHPFCNRLSREEFAAFARRFKAVCGVKTFDFEHQQAVSSGPLPWAR